MTGIIVAKGRTTRKTVEFHEPGEFDVTPVVTADGGGRFSRLGVGFYVDADKKPKIIALGMPNLLVRSWRAMKLLEELPRLDMHRTLFACWSAASEQSLLNDARHIQHLAAMFPSAGAFRAIRARVLSMDPSGEMTAMLNVIEEHDLDIDVTELRATLMADPRPVESEILSRLMSVEMGQ